MIRNRQAVAPVGLQPVLFNVQQQKRPAACAPPPGGTGNNRTSGSTVAILSCLIIIIITVIICAMVFIFFVNFDDDVSCSPRFHDFFNWSDSGFWVLANPAKLIWFLSIWKWEIIITKICDTANFNKVAEIGRKWLKYFSLAEPSNQPNMDYLVQFIEHPILRILNFNFSNLRCCKVCLFSF